MPRYAPGGVITPADYREAQAKAMTEDQLLRAVRSHASQLGWRTMHQLHSRGTEPGWPDLVLVRKGRLLIRELKTIRGRLTPTQVGWLNDLTAAGVDAGVWRPDQLLSGQILNELTTTKVTHSEPRRTP